MRWKDESKTILIVTIKPEDGMKEMAQKALDVQNACNLCGVAQSFAEEMKKLLNHPQNKMGSTWMAQHPITKTWINKLEHLAELPQDNQGLYAVMDLAEGKEVEYEFKINGNQDLAYWRDKIK